MTFKTHTMAVGLGLAALSFPALAQADTNLTLRCYQFQCTGDLGLIATQVAAWDESRPDVTVEVQVVEDWGGDILGNDIAAGSAPDLILYEASYARAYIKRGMVRPLDDWFDTAALQADFLPDYWNNFMASDGKLYGIYQDTEARGVYYRTDWLTSAGLTPPENGWTFAEMRELARALTTPDHAGICIGKEIFYELGMVVAGGHDFTNDFSYTSDAVRSLYQFYADMIADGSAVANQGGLSRDQCMDLLVAGKAAMVFSHNNFISGFLRGDAAVLTPDQVDFVSLPVANAGDAYRSVGGGFQWIVPSADRDDETEAALRDLITYVTAPEQQIAYARAWGFVLPRLSYQEALIAQVSQDPSDVLFDFWPTWLEISRANLTNQPDNPDNMVWIRGLVAGVDVIQAGQSVDAAIEEATAYFDTNRS